VIASALREKQKRGVQAGDNQLVINRVRLLALGPVVALGALLVLGSSGAAARMRCPVP
jgi:hypothetical protein